QGQQVDAAAQAQANQAQREALERALAVRQADAGTATNPDGDAVGLVQGQAAEQEQAQQLWLRRVPDEPGALLRRRLQLEQERRQWQR
ncbi:MAG: hypothetical protein ACI4NW_13335, partial [Stenotrophomonas sp.]